MLALRYSNTVIREFNANEHNEYKKKHVKLKTSLVNSERSSQYGSAESVSMQVVKENSDVF